MKVRAKSVSTDEIKRVVGYVNHKRIREGEIFEIQNEKQFSEKWMEKIDKQIISVSAAPKPKVVEAPIAVEGTADSEVI
jgi:hypothetical protein